MKKNATVLAIAFMLVGCLSASSQVYNDFDLKTFLVPDITRNALDFNLNSAGEMNDVDGSDEDKYSVSGYFGSEFNRFKNSRSFWGTQKAAISTSGNYYKRNEPYSKSSGFLVNITYENKSRFYRKNNFFLGVGGNAFGQFNGTRRKEEMKTKFDEDIISLSVPLSVGKGRIEVVTDARQAIYILENLSRQGVMKRKLSNGEILSLAKVIAQVKNKRFLDSRLRMIEEISTVDSFFVQNDLLSTNGASYFTTLYDYWMYGDRFERLTGLVLEGTISPGFQYRNRRELNQTNNHDYKAKQYIPSIMASVSLTYENPVNLYWQHSGEIALSGNYTKYNYKEDDRPESSSVYGGLNGTYKWGYYPTSRTNINFGVSENLSLNGSKFDEGDKDYDTYFNATTGLFLQTYYYFSPQLRLSAEANVYYSYSKALKDRNDYKYSRFNPSFQLSLTYSLF